MAFVDKLLIWLLPNEATWALERFEITTVLSPLIVLVDKFANPEVFNCDIELVDKALIVELVSWLTTLLAKLYIPLLSKFFITFGLMAFNVELVKPETILLEIADNPEVFIKLMFEFKAFKSSTFSAKTSELVNELIIVDVKLLITVEDRALIPFVFNCLNWLVENAFNVLAFKLAIVELDNPLIPEVFR
jgi:hypothetical protein